ncbi:hypothetical protein GCM10027431_01110 [Lysobacter rhizosphaerae]
MASNAAAPCGLFGVALLVSAVVHLLVFHPFYFGDELFNFAMAESTGRDFLATFSKLNSYKPRIFFNGWWALIATAQWPRVVPMLISSFFLAGTLVAACLLVGLRDKRAILLQILVAAVITTCRFSAMLPFDYVASIIEYSSLAFFLFGIYLLTKSEFLECPGLKVGLAVLALFAAAIFSHERYVAPVFAVGSIIAIGGLVRRRPVVVAWGAILGGAAPLSFILFSKLISVVPLATGTAGLSVAIGHDTLEAAGIYLSNLFASTSLGHEWFFVKLAPGMTSHLLVVVSVLALLVWLFGVFRIRNWSEGSLYLLASMFALLLIACLPGTSRQEARWLFPVFVVFAILVATHGIQWARMGMLLALLMGNLLFLYKGDLQIYNVVASSQARDLSMALNHVKAPGKVGLIVGAREPDVSWMLGGGAFGPGLSATPGVQFSKLNLPAGLHVYRSPSDAMGQVGRAPDFGVMPVGAGTYALLTQRELQSAISGEAVPLDQLRKLGGDGAWDAWSLRGLVPDGDGALNLKGSGDGFLRVPVQELEGRRVVYRMRTSTNTPVQARLQVNWMEGSDKFLAAAIQVVDVTDQAKDYSMFLTAPLEATDGLVYVTLASPGQNPVHVEFVGVEQ